MGRGEGFKCLADGPNIKTFLTILSSAAPGVNEQGEAICNIEQKHGLFLTLREELATKFERNVLRHFRRKFDISPEFCYN